MPWRLIGFILIFAIFLVFITSNLDNKCDISLQFVVFESVPVYLVSFIAFALGMLSAIPYIIALKIKGARAQSGKVGASPKKKLFGKKDVQQEAEIAAPVDENK
jgi:uncharacterized integral membrane protein